MTMLFELRCCVTLWVERNELATCKCLTPLVAAILSLGLVTGPSWATLAYTPAGGPFPVIGPGVVDPHDVGGKEYSNSFDETSTGGGGGLLPEQVIAWDGIGGALDGLNYAGGRAGFPDQQEVDAIAHHNDFLFDALKSDDAHLIFSHDDIIHDPGIPGFAPIIPAIGPVMLSNGKTIGGAGEVSIEESGFFSGIEVQALWASATDVNGEPTPDDVDGLEVWGPEPATMADADKYSLEFDIPAGAPLAGGTPVSVFMLDPLGGSFPYIDHPTIIAAVESLLGTVSPSACNRGDLCGIEAVNVDALMVQERVGSERIFEAGDEIIFSISQMYDASGGSYYATGSELFVLDGSGAVSYLFHGGHDWDPAYAMASLSIDQSGIIDINAIEAVSEGSIPEPTALFLATFGMITLGLNRRRLN